MNLIKNIGNFIDNTPDLIIPFLIFIYGCLCVLFSLYVWLPIIKLFM